MNPRKNRQWQALQKYENKRPPKRTGRVKKTRRVHEIKKIDRNLASPKATGAKNFENL